MTNNSNTTLVKVKFYQHYFLNEVIKIQIQHLLKLNLDTGRLKENLTHSNTTFVKVK